MRRVTGRVVSRVLGIYKNSSEDGVVLVFVAVSMVVLLGAMAVSVDVGRIYQERRELQNGADAAALAVAHDCASGDCGASETTAGQYASANAGDGLAGIEFVNIDHGAQKVTVRTMTADPDNGNTFPMTVAQVVGFNGLTVKAEATVEWDGLLAGPSAPILFQSSSWNEVRDLGRLSTVEEATSGSAPANQLITFAHRSAKGPDRDLADPSGALFEWLSDSVDCSVDVEVGVSVDHESKSESELPAGCSDILDTVTLVTLFDGHLDNPSTSKIVSGIGAMYVTDMSNCGADGFCVTGYLIKNHVVNGLLGGGDFGVSAIQFVAE